MFVRPDHDPILKEKTNPAQIGVGQGLQRRDPTAIGSGDQATFL